MPNWKKVAVSGSAASFSSLTVDTSVTASIFSGSQFIGNLSGTASYALTASYANQFNVAQALTASGLKYPTADGLEYQSLQTNGAGTLAFDYTKTLYKKIKNGESTSIVKGTPLFVSGSQGDLAIVYIADANNPARMPATVIAFDNSLASGAEGTAIILGLIENVNTTGYAPGTSVYVGVGGGWTATRPTGSAVVQPLGVVTREGTNGAGIVLTVPPTELPNVQSGYTWVGDVNGVPQAVTTSSINNVVSSSYALTASYALNGGSGGASGGATTGSNTFFGDQTISGSLVATGSVGASVILTSQTASSISIPTGYNGLLLTPVQMQGSSSIALGSRLIVL